MLGLVLPPLLFLAVLGRQVVAGGPLVAADERLARTMRADSPPTALAEILADLGNPEVALPVLAAAVAYAGWRGRRWWPPLAAVAAMAAAPVVVVPLKALTDRPGPLGGTGYFPSGHATTAVVAYGAAALLVLPYVRPSVRRPLLAATALLCAAAGAGLVWRGYHWPLDVLGGWCLGGPLLVAVRCRAAPSSSGPVPVGRAPRHTGTVVVSSDRPDPPGPPGPSGPERSNSQKAKS
ncbi:MAG TPA: phosphatase PAP2 family protein [Streptomyces sp.]|nr:phosphatase PAP2 family protein [Streptomyces sp.]